MTPYSQIAIRSSLVVRQCAPFISVLLVLSVPSLLAYADDDLYPAAKIRGHISINLATGERTINQTSTAPRNGTILWDCTSNWPFFGLATTYERLDWGDISTQAATGANTYEFAYCSNGWTPDPNVNGLSIQFAFYVTENGHNSPMPPSIALFVARFDDFPGVYYPGEPYNCPCGQYPPSGCCDFGCWTVDVDLAAACAIDPNYPCTIGLAAASDIDGDGLVDFGYGMYVPFAGITKTGGEATSGPIFAYPGPDPVGAPGADLHAYDRYNPPGKWNVGNTGFLATVDNGVQMYLRLLGCSAGDSDADGVCDDVDACPTIAGPPPTGCPACPDITGDDQVNLSDLAIVLSNFGLTPATYAQGDINYDNRIDLSDLAAMLSAYGATCP